MSMYDRNPSRLAAPVNSANNRFSQVSRSFRLSILLLSGLAVVCALLLPFAPVNYSVPTVHWSPAPLGGMEVQNSTLNLTNQEPISTEITFTPEALTGSAGTVLFKSRPIPNQAEAAGLPAGAPALEIIEAGNNSFIIRVSSSDSFQSPVLSAGPSTTVTLEGNTISVTGTSTGYTARLSDSQLPGITALITDLPVQQAGHLSASVQVFDAATSSTTLKKTLLVICLAAAGAALLTFVFSQRHKARAGDGAKAHSRSVWIVPTIVVSVGMTCWTIFAPLTDDDGYFIQMARSSLSSGYYGLALRLFDQPYTPFTWPGSIITAVASVTGWHLLPLRIVPFLCGIITWFGIVAVLKRAISSTRLSRYIWLAVLVFLGFWSLLGVTLRPEPYVSLLLIWLIYALMRFHESSSSILWGYFAIALMALSVGTHPGGLILLVGAVPLIGTFIQKIQLGAHAISGLTPWIATIYILSGGVWGIALAFGGSPLSSFLLSQQIQKWDAGSPKLLDELNRYIYIAQGGTTGSVPHRLLVVSLFITCAAFLVQYLWQRSKSGKSSYQYPLSLVGWITLASIIGLAIIPSKWVLHFGMFISVASVLMVLMIAQQPHDGHIARTRWVKLDVSPTRRLPLRTIATLAGVSLATAIPIAFIWDGSWKLFPDWVRVTYFTTHGSKVGPFNLNSVSLWTGLIFLVLILTLSLSRSTVPGNKPPRLASVLRLTYVKLYPSFFIATSALIVVCIALPTVLSHQWSVGRMSIEALRGDPCTTENDLRFYDSSHGTYLSKAQGAYGNGQWFSLPSDTAPGDALIVRLDPVDKADSTVTIEYANSAGDILSAPEGTRQMHFANSMGVAMEAKLPDPPSDASFIRVFTAEGMPVTPVLTPLETVSDRVMSGSIFTLSWQLAGLFPCVQPPVTQKGLSTSANYAIAYGTPFQQSAPELSRRGGGLGFSDLTNADRTVLVTDDSSFRNSVATWVVRYDYGDLASNSFQLDPQAVTNSGAKSPISWPHRTAPSQNN